MFSGVKINKLQVYKIVEILNIICNIKPFTFLQECWLANWKRFRHEVRLKMQHCLQDLEKWLILFLI